MRAINRFLEKLQLESQFNIRSQRRLLTSGFSWNVKFNIFEKFLRLYTSTNICYHVIIRRPSLPNSFKPPRQEFESSPQSCLCWLHSVRCFYPVISVDETSTVCLSDSWPPQLTAHLHLSINPNPTRRRAGRNGSFPLVHGLTDCCCNFPVKAFLCEVRACLTPDARPTAAQKPPVFIYWWISGFLKAHPVN